MSKINKLGKSTFVIAILSFLLVAVLAFGGTYAYFSDKTNTATGSFTTGKIQLTDLGTGIFVSSTDEIVPGAKLASAVSLTGDVNVKTMLVAVMTIAVPTTSDIAASDIVLKDGSPISVGNWKSALANKESTEGTTKTVTNAYVYDAGTNQFYVESIADEGLAFTGELYLNNTVDNGTTTDGFENQNASITITITFYAVQYDYLAGNGVAGNYTSAAAAYTAAQTVYPTLPTA